MTSSTQPLLLAPLLSSHIDAVVEIEEQSAFMPWPRRLFGQCLRAGYINHVLLYNNKVEGFSLCSSGAGEAHLQNIVIRATQQGQGWGRWLLEQTLTQLRSHHLQRVFLEVRASNMPAIQLYQNHGFENVGLRKDYYDAPVGREDAYVYMLEL